MASGLPAHRLLMLATLVMSLLFSAPLSAQGPDKETAAKVLRLVKDANDEFDRGEFADALSLYEEAYDLYPDAVLLYRIGLAADKAEKPRRAVEAYQAFVDAAKSDDATAKKVSERIAELRATMPPRVTVTSLPAGADVFVGSVDGPALGQTPGEFDVEQGKTKLAIRLKGYKVVLHELDLDYGATETVDIELEALEGLADSNVTPETPTDGGGGSLGTIGWVTTGVGVALIGTGAVFAVLTAGATSDVNDYDKRAEGATRAELDELKDKANSLHSTSVITFVAGGVVTAVGVSLIVVDMLTKDDASARIAPTMGIGQHGAWVGVGGRF